MLPSRRHVIAAVIAALAASGALAAARDSLAQDYPSRPIRIIVPRAPGGGSDIISRLIQPGLQQKLGQTIVVENKPDASAVLGADLVAKSKPDGYTLYLSDNSFYQNPPIIPNLPYDTIKDFTAVTMLAQAPVILITNPSVPANNVQELVALAKATPGKLSFASGGIGASTHYAGVLLNVRAGIELLHVPYKSSGQAMTALLGNEVSMQFGGISSARAQIEAGKVRAIAVTGDRRDPSMPNVPTFAEGGIAGVDIVSVWGLHAAAGTPIEIRRKLRDAVVEVMREVALAKRLGELGYAPIGSTPEEHQKQTGEIVALWLDISKRIKLNE